MPTPEETRVGKKRQRIDGCCRETGTAIRISSIATRSELNSSRMNKCSQLELLQNEILFMIISFLTDDKFSLVRAVFGSLGLASKSCQRACASFVHNTPLKNVLVPILHETTSTAMILNWILQNQIKIKELEFIFHPTDTFGTIGFNTIRQIVTVCDLKKLKSFTIFGLIAASKSDYEIKFIRNGLVTGFPLSLMDEWYQTHAAITQQCAALEVMKIYITKETFHRPILSKFADSLIDLQLGIFSVNNQVSGHGVNSDNQFEEISEAIEQMPNLKHLHLWDVANASCIHTRKSIIIRSETLRTLKLHFLFLKACICSSLCRLHCTHESLLEIEGNTNEFTNDGNSIFTAGASGIRLVGVDVPKSCVVEIDMGPNEEDSDLEDRIMIVPPY